MWLEVLLPCLTIVAVAADNSAVREMGQGVCRLQWSVTRRVLRGRYFKVVEEPHHIDFCCAGYSKVEHTDDFDASGFQCVPVCEPRCQGSNCTAPGFCECFPGYIKLHSSSCIPQCIPKCVNSTCVAANKCQCHEGHVATDDSHVCQPHCPISCVHADCVAPNTCRCHKGFEPTSSTICHAVCSLECESGYCSAPDECTCFSGYTVSDDNWNVCVPYCSQGCTNALCTSPEVCSCLEGFEKSKDNDTQCEPVCSKGCVNAECIAPDECACFDGFINNTRGVGCTPFCSDDCGDHGDCVSPDKCVCHEGYQGATCEPRCPAGGCVNGECSRPGYCGCGDGFIKVNLTYCLMLCPESSDTCYKISTHESTGDFLVTDSNDISLSEDVKFQVDFCNSIINANFTLNCFTEVAENESIASVICGFQELFHSFPHESQHNLTKNSFSSINFTFVYPQNISNEFDCRLCLLNSSESDSLTVISFTGLGLIFVTSFFVVLFLCSRKITSYKVHDFEDTSRRRADETSESGQVALMESFQGNDDCDDEFES